jgi:hypothetical protein
MGDYYTNTTAFKRAFLTRDIFAEQAYKIRLHNETKDRIDDEIEKRDEQSFLGKAVGAVAGWFIGGPDGAKIGSDLLGSIGQNSNNTGYAEFLPGQNDYLGKFYMAQDLADYKEMVQYAEDLEYMQDTTQVLDVIGMGKDLFMTDWDLSGWEEKDFGEKLTFTKESYQENKMADFQRAWKEIIDFEPLDSAEAAFQTAITDELSANIEKLLYGLADEYIVGGDLTLENINQALNAIGIESIGQEVLERIMNLSEVAFTEDEEE